MEISERKLAANRANAAKSTGPKTPEGKRNSSLNGKRYSFLANTILIDGESDERFAALVNSFYSDYDPQDSIEQTLVEKMAICHWRLIRIWALETASLRHETRNQTGDIAALAPPERTMLALRAMSDTDRHPDILGRHERRYDREYQQAMSALAKYRNEKTRIRSHQPDESKEPLSKSEPTTNPCGADGSVCQDAPINSSTNALKPLLT